MSRDPNQQHGQYPPPSWESRSPRGGYPPPPSHEESLYGGPSTSQTYQQTSPSGAPLGPGEMVTLPPPPSQPHPEIYRQGPYEMFQGHPHHASYPQISHDPHQNPQPPHLNFSQPAPRQRTAIACRYCRRRKIRCHGFDSSPDGRCTNCIRFHQECIFTPVSSQAHAFVPAHTAYPHLRNTGQMHQQPGGRPMYTQDGQPVIYGAHGQPLGPIPQHGPDHSYPPHGYVPNPYPGPVYDERGGIPQPHLHEQPRLSTSTGGRRGSGGNAGQFEYPDPTGLAPVSPTSSTTSYQSSQYPPQPPQQQPYYPSQQSARRSSPQSAYSYDPRASGSPHGSTSSTAAYAYPGGLHPPQVLPPNRDSGRTPPPATAREGSVGGNGSRASMSVRDMLGPDNGQGGRTSADSDMLKALNKRGM